MARTLKTYRQSLTEKFQVQITEIGQRVKPFQTVFDFKEISNGYQSEFHDADKNTIVILFYTMHYRKPNHNKIEGYEIDFMINGSSFGNDVSMTLKSFFPLISTVVECINVFIDKFNPDRLYIESAEKSGKMNQKQKIWKEYVLQNIKDTGFVVGSTEGNYIVLQNNRKKD